MLKFEKSEYADSIYYADMFRIEGRVWMIMGFGKSEAPYIATNKKRDCDLCRDCVAIRAESGKLQGRYDPGGINSAVDSGLFDFYNIDFVAYCLSPEDTRTIYREGVREIRETKPEIMAELSVSYPYPAYVAPQLFSEAELAWLNDPGRRAARFLDITAKVTGSRFVIVPFMETVEEKAALYLSYGTK